MASDMLTSLRKDFEDADFEKGNGESIPSDAVRYSISENDFRAYSFSILLASIGTTLTLVFLVISFLKFLESKYFEMSVMVGLYVGLALFSRRFAKKATKLLEKIKGEI